MKLNNKIDENQLSTYSLYLQYERIKCCLQMYKTKGMRMLTKKMFAEACHLGSVAWQVNALMLTIINESRIGHLLLCTKILKFVINLSVTLGNDNVTEFLIKVRFMNSC